MVAAPQASPTAQPSPTLPASAPATNATVSACQSLPTLVVARHALEGGTQDHRAPFHLCAGLRARLPRHAPPAPGPPPPPPPPPPTQPASPLTAPAPAPFTTVSACLLAMMGWSRRRCFHLQVTVLTQTGC